VQKDERDLLEVLKSELEFLQKGGYTLTPKVPWRPIYIFEDSPACINFNAKENRTPCSECVLMQLVPPERRSEKIPCRHIPFNAGGETLDSLYRYNDQQEIEATVGNWLRTTIQRLEEERMAVQQSRRKSSATPGKTVLGTPLYQRQHPKCANPACPTAFHWTGGGKFFRFRPEVEPAPAGDASSAPPGGVHGVRHYWLCERCSHVFTLIYEEEYGVIVRLIWPELAGEENHKVMPAA